MEADPAVYLCANTTIGVVLTNARLTKAQATKAFDRPRRHARAIARQRRRHRRDLLYQTFRIREVEAASDHYAVRHRLRPCRELSCAVVEQAEGAYAGRRSPPDSSPVRKRATKGSACQPNAVRRLVIVTGHRRRVRVAALFAMNWASRSSGSSCPRISAPYFPGRLPGGRPIIVRLFKPRSSDPVSEKIWNQVMAKVKRTAATTYDKLGVMSVFRAAAPVLFLVL